MRWVGGKSMIDFFLSFSFMKEEKGHGTWDDDIFASFFFFWDDVPVFVCQSSSIKNNKQKNMMAAPWNAMVLLTLNKRSTEAVV
jgi:hypothetical protein